MNTQKTIKTIIIDDSKKSVQNLSYQFKTFFPDIDLIGNTNSFIDGIQMIKTYKPKLLLIDFLLSGLNGNNQLKTIIGFNIPIIFLSNDNKHAQAAIKYSPVDYLIKPVLLADLKFAIEKVRKQKKTNNKFNN